MSGASVAFSGSINKSLVGTITRTNGKKQITYDGHPLYTFTSDTTPGMITGEGIDAFGGHWYVMSPAGKVITETGSSSTTSSPSGNGY
ncbi:MAG: COG4315 family predicted lipoprotein [Ferrimicrobium sp.]